MVYYAVAWGESEDRSGAGTNLSAISDTLINTQGDNLRLQAGFNNINMVYTVSSSATYRVVQSIISSASIASNPLEMNKGIAKDFLNQGAYYEFFNGAYNYIEAGDDVTATAYEDDEAGVAHNLSTVMFVSDQTMYIGQPSLPITHIAKATSSGAVSANTWTEKTLTLETALPAGQYAFIGADVLSDNGTLTSARFVFQDYKTRPAVVPKNDSNQFSHPINYNVYDNGGYQFTIPDGLPTCEVLTGASTTLSFVNLYLSRLS